MAPIILKVKASENDFSPFADLDNGEDLARTWKTCTKVKDTLENGSRLENLSWRLWHLHQSLVQSRKINTRQFRKLSSATTKKLEETEQQVSPLSRPRTSFGSQNGANASRTMKVELRTSVDNAGAVSMEEVVGTDLELLFGSGAELLACFEQEDNGGAFDDMSFLTEDLAPSSAFAAANNMEHLPAPLVALPLPSPLVTPKEENLPMSPVNIPWQQTLDTQNVYVSTPLPTPPYLETGCDPLAIRSHSLIPTAPMQAASIARFAYSASSSNAQPVIPTNLLPFMPTTKIVSTLPPVRAQLQHTSTDTAQSNHTSTADNKPLPPPFSLPAPVVEQAPSSRPPVPPRPPKALIAKVFGQSLDITAPQSESAQPSPHQSSLAPTPTTPRLLPAPSATPSPSRKGRSDRPVLPPASRTGRTVTCNGILQCENCSTTTTPLWRRSSEDKLLCNALKLHNVNRPKTLRPSSKKDADPLAECWNCHTKNTPLWRRDDDGHTLCNACGFLKLHNAHRPLSLKSDVVRKRHRMDLAEYATPVDAEAGEALQSEVQTQTRPRKKVKAELAEEAGPARAPINVSPSPIIHPQQYQHQQPQMMQPLQPQQPPQHIALPIVTSIPTAPHTYHILAAPPIHTFRLQHPTYTNPALQHFQEKR
ncbi:hypothetical protein HK097_002430 [Rhizophlyctis rosea]|uniref:GATA-type domain-containing protein n=1 Tax=Rhizophlyctis rosea TaxID=64517 RepID=A0AAD5SMW8_9FUNG|nr:hypothetical protein HK097_002430 [Rhizophlyctis rosea]